MSQISATQTKAARAYLEWSQEDLAKAAGVSLSTVRSLENGFTPRTGTINQIRKTLETAGIEFLEDEGIRRQSDIIKIYQGPDSCDKFFDSMLHEIKEPNSEIISFISSHNLLFQPSGINHRSNRDRLELLNKTIPVKCVVATSDTSSGSLPSFQIRALADHAKSPSSFYIYGDKIAFMHLDRRMQFIFTVFNIPLLAQDYKAHFSSLSEQAFPLPVQIGMQPRSARIPVEL